jgi:hypothetical protein
MSECATEYILECLRVLLEGVTAAAR